jgi:SOS-response transcriptional repressor LexA
LKQRVTAHGDPPSIGQRQVLVFIAEFIDRHGYAPSMNDIRRRFNFASINAARDHLVALEKKGLITRQFKIARSLRLTQLGLEKTGRLSPDRIRTSFDRTRPSRPGQCPPTVTASPEKENEP